jgi:hypothetical protein
MATTLKQACQQLSVCGSIVHYECAVRRDAKKTRRYLRGCLASISLCVPEDAQAAVPNLEYDMLRVIVKVDPRPKAL